MQFNYEPSHVRLDILTQLSYLYPKDILEDYFFIGCQHILPSTHLMIRSCFDMGLKPEKTALIGKCYSTSHHTQKLMQSEGIYICPSSQEFDSHRSYDDQFQENIQKFYVNVLKQLKIPPQAKLIILDDGGELITLISELSSYYEKIVCVEQTSAGYHKIKNIELKVPVINVARCSLKLKIESPEICKTQIDIISKFIKKLNIQVKKILVMGKGALGQFLYQSFKFSCDVTCYDKNKTLSDIHRAELDISIYDLIIGATGSTILSSQDYGNLKKGAILASSSSSDREFDAFKLRKKIGKTHNCHTNLEIGGVHLLNCGFPLNFQGSEKDTIALEKIQLTIALLFSAIFQGILFENEKAGLIHYNDNNSIEVMKNYF